MSTMTIDRVYPQAGVHGGRIAVYCQGLDPEQIDTYNLLFGVTPSRTMLATPTLVLGVVPREARPSVVQLERQGQTSNAVPFTVATAVAENLHPVANPVVDGRGAIYTTISGTKGQHVPVSLYRISPEGEVEPFAADILNPTGLAFGPDDHLYVSSRHTGKVLRVDARGTVSTFAENLGIATGLAFDAQGRLYVGDRRGTIYQLSATGQAQVFVSELEPSVTAYHLAFDSRDQLCVSYPTFSGYDRVYRITAGGDVQTIASGLGRPQGLAFDADDNLYVIGHYRGEGGVVKITPAGEVQHVICGANLVGLAFGVDGELIVVDNSTLYKLNFGVQGRPRS
jgi:sugar lactone lactonase YvrE